MSELAIIRAIEDRIAHQSDLATAHGCCSVRELRLILGLAKQGLYVQSRAQWRKATAEWPEPGTVEGVAEGK